MTQQLCCRRIGLLYIKRANGYNLLFSPFYITHIILHHIYITVTRNTLILLYRLQTSSYTNTVHNSRYRFLKKGSSCQVRFPVASKIQNECTFGVFPNLCLFEVQKWLLHVLYTWNITSKGQLSLVRCATFFRDVLANTILYRPHSGFLQSLMSVIYFEKPFLYGRDSRRIHCTVLAKRVHPSLLGGGGWEGDQHISMYTMLFFIVSL